MNNNEPGFHREAKNNHRMPEGTTFFEKALPALIVSLAFITGLLILIAVGVLLGIIDSDNLSGTLARNSSLRSLLPFSASIVMLFFTSYVLQRFIRRRKLNFLFWGIGLAMFGLASFSEAYLSLAWNRWVFFAWYYFGAILTAAWIGQGTVYLLARKRRAHILTLVLIAGSLVTLGLMLRIMPDLNESIFSVGVPISEQYREIMPPISSGGYVRLTTPFFNIYGLLTLVGGALWSTFLFWRKRVLPNRAIGNVLIALGALIIASTSTLTRLGYGSLLYLGEILAAIIMFGGFLTAVKESRHQVEEKAAYPKVPAV